MGRGGAPRSGGIRRRMCLGCRTVRPQRELARIVAGGSGAVFDGRQALPGRGAYVCHSEACATKASRLLAKALRSPGLNVAPGWLWAAVGGPAPQDGKR